MNSIIEEIEETRMETRKRRMDERAAEDPQPVVKRTDTGNNLPAWHHRSDTAQAQQFENVPDTFAIADAEKSKGYSNADKADTGKPDTLILDQDFPDASEAVAAVFNYGAQKYARLSFYRVPFDAWEKAEGRHKRARYRKELIDPESGLLHLALEVANKLVMLQLYIKANPGIDYTKFNAPPQDHKHG